MTRILLQTTIEPVEEDWHIGRFGLLRAHLAGLRAADGSSPLHDVVARDRATPAGTDDPVLAALDTSSFDELWLFAVDTGEGLTARECAAIGRFHERGGGLMAARDHQDLGSSLCHLGGVGAAHHFHSINREPDVSRRRRDDPYSLTIDWPNYHAGANGDAHAVEIVAPLHPLLLDPSSPGGAVRLFPAHPHEGAVGVPDGERRARVIATGRSLTTGRDFNLVVAFEAGPGGRPGRAAAHASFHHFCDYNWDATTGCPRFAEGPTGDGMRRDPEARHAIETYTANLARWLAPERATP